MSKYKNGKIYKVVCDETNLTYYGSTIQPLFKRLWRHKQKNEKNGCMTMKMTNPKIFLVEDYPCERKEQLLMRERYYIDNNECCNKLNCIRTEEEKQEHINKTRYNYNNSENGKKQKKKWELKNRDKIYKKKNEKRLIARREEISTICICGGSYKKDHKARHEKTKKHINFLILN